MPSFFFNDTATTEISPLSLHTLFRSLEKDHVEAGLGAAAGGQEPRRPSPGDRERSEEHTSEIQSRLHLVCRLFFLMIRRPPRSPLFPYTRSSDLSRRITSRPASAQRRAVRSPAGPPPTIA